MSIKDRGFASMDPERKRAIASQGGRVAHEKGTAHEWTREEAREAGRKGGKMSRRRQHAQPSGDGTVSPPMEAGDAPRPEPD